MNVQNVVDFCEKEGLYHAKNLRRLYTLTLNDANWFCELTDKNYVYLFRFF